MGNTSTKESSESKNESSYTSPPPNPTSIQVNEVPSTSPKSGSPSFRMLDANSRSITFDERRHLTKKMILGQTDFRPLRRAVTYDSRHRSQNSLSSVEDVLHRRYFNVKPIREEKPMPLSSIHEDALEKYSYKGAVIVVDPFSSGTHVALEVMNRGYACITVYSDILDVMKGLLNHVPIEIQNKYTATIYHDGSDDSKSSIDRTLSEIQKIGLDVVAVLPGAETGVLLADILSEKLGLLTNGTNLSEARRNKYTMGETIRNAGLRAVKQCSATKWSQVVDFILNDLKPEPFEVIVKPVESAGSDDVTLCKSMEEVQQAFGNIQGKINGLGLENKSTLIQEYLRGTEYVVDTVSRDGKHKVVAVWEYDKRAVNGAAFVYYGVLLRAAAGEIITPIIEYILKVLDALNIKNGPGHAEVKWVNGEPCLVEIGSRCHGGDASYVPIVDDCIGYNQVKVSVDSYLDAKAFDVLPELPISLKRFGCEAMLVSYSKGVMEKMPGMDEIYKLPSYLSSLIHVKPGDEISTTIDMFTTPGSIMLMHDSEEQLKRDYDRIRDLEVDGLFELGPALAVCEIKSAVAVVDPFSTGAFVAKYIADRGYPCICVYSDTLEKMEHVASLVPEGLELQFDATVAHNGNIAETVRAIEKAAASLGANVKAIIPGAETGVRVADALVDILKLKGNVHEHADARRDKYAMGETLRKAGVRAVKQKKATNWEEAKAFIEDYSPNPFQIVLKPLESAGTDDVTLCLSMEEAERTFHSIIGKVNGLGLENTAVLLQEYLEGTEYVIDTVSHEGKHKVVCVWQYDKRRVNDAAFVYFGVNLISASSSIVNELIDYQYQVLDALGIKNGPAHGEVKYCRGSPVLVEVGARCHGGEGAWIPIANSCVGYNQVACCIDTYLNPQAFEALPERPLSLKSYGCEAMLVSYESGKLISMPGLKEIEKFPSFLRKEIYLAIGSTLRKTIDCFTTPGSIILLHEDQQVLNKNLQRIRELERNGLYEVEKEEN